MTVLLLHAAATWFMVGLIWFVQLVHYPLFERVPEPASPRYAREHQRRTSWVVVPAMLVEGATAGILAVAPPAPVDPLVARLGAVLLAGIWASTFLVQIPLHRRLLGGHEPSRVRRLVLSNTVRTALWSARGVVVCVLLAQAVAA